MSAYPTYRTSFDKAKHAASRTTAAIHWLQLTCEQVVPPDGIVGSVTNVQDMLAYIDHQPTIGDNTVIVAGQCDHLPVISHGPCIIPQVSAHTMCNHMPVAVLAICLRIAGGCCLISDASEPLVTGSSCMSGIVCICMLYMHTSCAHTQPTADCSDAAVMMMRQAGSSSRTLVEKP